MSDPTPYRQEDGRWVKRIIRRILYSRCFYPMVQEWLSAREAQSPHRNRSYWDQLATSGGRSPASFLGGYAQIEVRNSITAALIRSFAPGAKSVLDVGCAAGLLGVELASHGLRRYVGIDLSEVAVNQAQENLSILARPAFSFQLAAADLIDFSPGQELFDVIVFNEVLYYIPVEQAVKQTVRFSGFLQPRGLICLSCLGDAKSQAIFRELRSRFEWVSGFICQESTGFQSRLDARSRYPACQSAVLRPR